jgi:hypothetical protein
MKNTMVLRTELHIVMSGDLSLCGLSSSEMVEDGGDITKIKGVKHREGGCISCLRLLLAKWEGLVAEYQELTGVMNQYSPEVWQQLVDLLNITSALIDDNAEPDPAPAKKAAKKAAKRPAKGAGS